MTYIPLNQIFYGPPGTGKTYHTINAALEILDPVIAQSTDRTLQKKRFDELLHEGKIRFVTFHQSFSYEDFVEGIRPVLSEDEEKKTENLVYKVESGIFKQICKTARGRIVKSTNATIDITGRKIWKMALGGKGEKDIYQSCIDENKICMGFGGDVDFSQCKSKDAIIQKITETYGQDTDNAILSLHRFVNEMKLGDIVVINDGLRHVRAIAEITGGYEIDTNIHALYPQMRKVTWLKVFEPSIPSDQFREQDLHRKALCPLDKFHATGLENLQKVINENPQEDSPSNYVLIIDEINRGNISGIFGELITLIEPSKRLGAEEELKVTLPYSRDTFGVPSNLYIIGTMNTADRSLTGLDIALRRRFTFVEMPPKPALLKNMLLEGTNLSMQEMLTVMNARIEALLGRDYCLGHAPFMHLGTTVTVEDLKPIFRNTILPLLQEYFFEDWYKMHLVLNDHRKSSAFKFIRQKNTDNLFGHEAEITLPHAVWEIQEEAFHKMESYVGIVDVT